MERVSLGNTLHTRMIKEFEIPKGMRYC